MTSVSQLNNEANSKVPHCQKDKSPKQYFQLGASYLRAAGQAKKSGDNAGAYLNLKKYILLVTERLPKHPSIKTQQFAKEYQFNLGKAQKMQPELQKLEQALGGGEKKKSSWFSWGSKKKEEPKNQVSTQHAHQQMTTRYDDTSDLNRSETVAYHAVGKLAYNDGVQDAVGKGVARIALNEEVQGKVADGVKTASLNRNYQRAVGNTIAENTDNRLVKAMATNEAFQKGVGVAMAKTVGNRDVQRKVGRGIAKAATNKKVQRAAAKGLMGAFKVGVKGVKFGGKTGLKLGKLAIEEKMRQDREDNQ